MSDDEPVTITCAVCGNPIVTVKQKVAEVFSSGTWLCSRDACHREQGQGRLL